MYLMQTVSSAPVARLRDQERSNFVDVESMETRGTNHHTRPESYKSETTQWTNSEDKSKKSKKWSIGKLFRRKKKESDTDSMTSDENSQKSVKKKKQSRKQADEVDGPHQQRSQSVMKVSNNKEHFDEGVLSDPSAGFVGYVGRGLPRSPFDRTHRSSRESLDKKGIDSLDGSLKKGKKGRIKARVEAIRNLKHESSSDDESQKSTSSSMMRFRSDDSLANHSKGEPNSKRSRSARTDRYIKRLSRDEEVSYGKEIENIQQILNRTSAEMMLKQRILSNPQINQYNIEEPEYYEPQKATYAVPAKPERSFSSGYLPSNLRQTITDSNSSVYSYPVGVINLNAKVNDENITYSIPYNSVNKTHTNKPQYRPENNNNYENEDVMVVKFPIGNVNHQVKKENVAPPVPPPRDPQRKVSTPLSYMYDNTRPISYNNSMHKMNGDVTKPINTYENSVPYRNENSLSWNKRPISTSVDHIAIQNNYQNIPPNCYQYNQPKRPSSVSAEVINPDIYNRYMSRPMINQIKPPISNNQNQEYLYFTDKTPRSRKPIHITPGVNVTVPINRPRNASEFWRKLDSQESQRRTLSTRTMSDQAISGPVPNLNVITNGDHTKRASISDHSTKSVKKDEPICYSNIDIIPMDDVRKDRKSHSGNSSDDDQSKRKKSTNLDDALSELEAIYNSLGLGDEDLLDRAEKRELMTPKSTEAFPFNSSSRDSFRLPNSPDIAKRLNRRSSIPDKLFDDMAFRRLNPSERPKSKDVNNLVSQISYMLASPALLEPLDVVPKCIPKTIEPEPDIVYDDVAFRNIRQKNNYLKTIDPQPPFGIPLGLVSPAPYSDYLHAIPDIKDKKPIQQDEPDLVTDDLAFRALRKDCKSQYDEENINKYIVPNPNQPSTIFDNHVIRKKRAVRSLSANIFTMIQKEIDDALEMCNNKPMEKTQSIPDLPESVIEFGKNGKLPEERKDVPNSYQTNASNTKKEEEKLMSRPPLASETKQEINNTKYPMKVTIEKKFNHPSDKNNFTVDYSTTVYTDRPQNVRITHETNMMNDANKADTSSQQTKEYKEHKDIPKTDTKGKCTEDSLIEISTHLNRIGDKIKLNPELKDNFEEEGMKLQALAKKCDIDLNDNMHQAKLNIESSLYKFLPKTNNDTVEMNKLSDKNSNSYNAKGDAIDKMTSFEDLRKGINDLLQGITQVSDKFNMKSNIIETRKESPLPDDDIDKRKDSRESPEYNSSEELAMIFNLGPESTTTKSIVVESKNLLPDKHLDLNSPRLVKNVNQNLIRQSSQERELGESSKASTSAIVESSSNDIPWRKPKREPSNDNTNRGVSDSKCKTWLQDSDTLMLACLCAMAYTQQLADVDILTLFGIVLATITVIAMLIL